MVVAISSLAPSSVKEIATKLYDVETRPELVAQGLSALGVQKLLDDKQLQLVASLSTVSGFLENKTALQEMAAPYIQKVYEKEGRKELLNEASELASEKVIKPTKEFAAPYIVPYIAKLETKRAEIVASKRYEKAVSALATLNEIREHPMETATELRSKAIDLLKYENLASYRDYIQSEEFQADTRRLVQVDLPALASNAASRGIETVKNSATALASEIDSKRAQLHGALERGYSAVKKIELDDLRARAKTLLAELQSELSEGVAHVRTEGFSLSDTIARIKKVVAAIDTIFITPVLTKSLETKVEMPTEEAASEAAPVEAAKAEEPVPPLTEDTPDVATGGGDVADEPVEGTGEENAEQTAPMDTLGPI